MIIIVPPELLVLHSLVCLGYVLPLLLQFGTGLVYLTTFACC